ncbi:MAG TPA: hypothetical protein VD737_09275, partial [Steroidobacteraceae bacterium]|nr:hypothetical protein [Steroidobacteraceae bacterium]
AIVFDARPRLAEPAFERDEATVVLDAEGDVVVAGDPGEPPNGVRVLGVEAPARRLRLADGPPLRYDSLNARLPLPRLVELLGRYAPRGVREAAATLRTLASSTGDAGDAGAAADFSRNVVRIHHWLATVDIRPSMPAADHAATEAERTLAARTSAL